MESDEEVVGPFRAKSKEAKKKGATRVIINQQERGLPSKRKICEERSE